MSALGVADIGFAICGLAFAGLAVTLRPGTAGTTAPRIRLRLAALATMAWSGVAWWMVSRGEIDSASAQLLSMFLVAVWLWQLEPLARWQSQRPWVQRVLRWSGAGALLLTAGWILLASRSEQLLEPSTWVLAVPGLMLCAFGLFMIEQIYRNAQEPAKRAVRWIGLGAGGILVTQLVFFSEALLLDQVPTAALPIQGAIFAACALATIRGARIMPEWSFGLSVSRHVAFYATSFTLIGAYLVLMSVVAWLLVANSDGWHPVARLGFAILAAAILGLSLFSGGLLRRLKVLISANFYPHRYDYRAEWLRFTQTLAGSDEAAAAPERAIRAVAQIVKSPRGALWRMDNSGHGYEQSAHWPADNSEEGRSLSAEDQLPAYLAKSGWLVDLSELSRVPELYQDLKLDLRSYASAEDSLIVPLLHREQLYGWIILDRPTNLNALDFEDRDLLKTAGRHVAAYLAQFDADARLAQARQFETYNRMTAFVMHDLKNIAAQLRLISQNAERHRRNPEFVDDSFRTIASSAARMTKLVSQLGSGGETGTMQTVDLATAAERAALRCSGQAPVPQVNATQRALVFADMERLSSVIEHAIRNAQDATPTSGEVRVETGGQDGLPYLAVTDTGEGMAAEFIRDRLFRPFDTTKGARGMGIGAFQIREYVTSLGGRVEVQSAPGRGTTIKLVFSPSVAQTL